MEYKIITNNTIRYIDQIQNLGDRHRKSLGFFPEGAFQEYARKNQIFCAANANRVLGYIMFRYSKKRNCVMLVHVCVDLNERMNGIAHELIDTVAHYYPNANYMEVRCRRDYNMDPFWLACGFHIRSEKDGRKLDGSDLTIWRKKLCTSNLLDYVLQDEKQDRVFAALDSNVVIQLCDEPTSTDHCLLDDKIHDDVKYCVTPECLNEINKKEDASVRRRQFDYVLNFCLLDNVELDESLVGELTAAIDPNGSHHSDVKHLAYCISSEMVDAFITNDRWIHDQAEYFIKNYNLMIFYPQEFFIYVFSSDEYSVDRKITGSKYQIKSLDNKTINDAINLHQAAGERKNTWEAELRNYLIDDSICAWLLFDDQGIVGLISLKKLNTCFVVHRIIITVTVERRIFRYLVMSLLNRVIIYLAKNTEISILYLPNSCDTAFLMFAGECGFIQGPSGAIKIIAAGAYKKRNLLTAVHEKLMALKDIPNAEKTALISHNIVMDTAQNHEYALEKLLGPTLIVDLEIPTYIISIKPQYAVELFDDDLSFVNQSLLDNPHVYAALSMTNAYYTTSAIRFSTPCRIIWYVTQSSLYTGTGSVRASSIMFFHKRGNPKELYKEYSQLGVLEWSNIREAKKLGVFLFDSTICFEKPISLHELQKMELTIHNKHLQLQGPMHIDPNLAQSILTKAMGDNACII